jgi:exopolysaccharide production protein ExoQ
MPPIIALLLWLILLLALLRFDPAREPGTSSALWVPLIWIFIVATRLPSQWLGGAVQIGSGSLEEGNPLDRVVFSALMVLAIVILMARRFNWMRFFSSNLALCAFLFFGLVSFIWSDFPVVALKRWFRDLGNYFMILVVLSDPRPFEAVRTLLRRLCYLVIPLSVLLIKYFPQLGKQYDMWTGANMFSGATTSKNMLGATCLISGLFFFWDTLTRWADRKNRQTKRIIWLNVALMAMTLWLLHLASSATSTVCLGIGCLVIVAARGDKWKQRSNLLKVLIPASFCLYLILAFGFDMNGQMAGAVGRDPTFTDRTVIWKAVLATHTNPFLGTGYESFWLGPRLDYVWRFVIGINEAHNGYLEVYLNLGLIGLALLVMFLLASYRNICKRLASGTALGAFTLSLWTILLFYNMTEAAFKGTLLWLCFLLGTMAIPEDAEYLMREPSAFGKAGARNWSSKLSVGNAGRAEVVTRPLDTSLKSANGTTSRVPQKDMGTETKPRAVKLSDPQRMKFPAKGSR